MNILYKLIINVSLIKSVRLFSNNIFTSDCSIRRSNFILFMYFFILSVREIDFRCCLAENLLSDEARMLHNNYALNRVILDLAYYFRFLKLAYHVMYDF